MKAIFFRGQLKKDKKYNKLQKNIERKKIMQDGLMLFKKLKNGC